MPTIATPPTPPPAEPAAPVVQEAPRHRRPRWKPRSSSLGYYLQCDYRAALDRAAFEGSIEPPARSESPYAALGTCIHAQTQFLCPRIMPGNITVAPETVRRASELFDGDEARLTVAIDRAAVLAYDHLPRVERGWDVEVDLRYGNQLTGHADFISADGEDLVDLKTTSRKPEHNRMKAEHLVQMHAYRLMKPTIKRGHVLYVDAMRAQWAMLITIDFTSVDSLEFAEQLKIYLKYLQSKSLVRRCFPRMGAHCSAGFCPWVTQCRDRFLPGPGVVHTVERTMSIRPATDPLASL